MTRATLAMRVPQTRYSLPLPPRIKVSYPRAMSTCIAAACRDEGKKPRIIICSDSRETWGYTSSDFSVKMDVGARGWVVQWANRGDSAKEFVARLLEWFDKAEDPQTVHAAVSIVGNALAEFKSSPLYEKNCCQLIVSGFVGNDAVILLIEGDKYGNLKMGRPESFAAIGAGSTIATVLLSCRQHHYTDTVANAIHAVYEAKRLSEKADGVGPFTNLWLHSPGYTGTHPPTANLVFVSVRGIETLEYSYRSRWGSRNETLSNGFWVPQAEIESVLYPKGDPSLPPPSPESPEAKNES
jgi:hypothetical protein